MFLSDRADVPRGTTPLMRIFTIILLCYALVSCNKPDPNPELKDPIYNDLNALLATTSQAIEAEKKLLSGHEKELNESIPQTGQVKRLQKRVGESKGKISRLEQEKSYLRLKIKARLKVARSTYARAYDNKEVWPNPQEWRSYEAEKKFRNAKKTWDVKDRMRELGLGATEAPVSKSKDGH